MTIEQDNITEQQKKKILNIQVDANEIYNRQIFGMNPVIDNYNPLLCHRDLGDVTCRSLISNQVISLKVDLGKDIDQILNWL